MLTLLQLLLPEVAAHHRVAVLVDPIDEVLAGFQEKSLNPLYVRAKTLLSPIPPRSTAQQTLPSKVQPAASQRDATPSRAALQRSYAGGCGSSAVEGCVSDL